MKKRFIYGMIALLSVSLFFLGCPTDADDGSGAYTPDTSTNGSAPTPAQAGKALTDALAAQGIMGATDDGNGNVTLPAGTTITKPVSIPSGVTVKADTTLTVDAPLTVEKGAGLNVPTGATINVDTGQSITVAGTYEIGGGVSGVNNGTVLIGSGAVVKSQGNLTGTGTNVVEAGGTVYFNDGSGPVFVGASGKFQLANGATFTYNNAGYAIAGGEVTLNDTDLVIDSEVQQLTIKKDGVLIIPSGQSLRLKTTGTDTATKPTLKGEDNAVVRIISTGSIVFDSCLSNFYLATNTSAETPVADSTYTWDATTAGGNTSTAGWERP